MIACTDSTGEGNDVNGRQINPTAAASTAEPTAVPSEEPTNGAASSVTSNPPSAVELDSTSPFSAELVQAVAVGNVDFIVDHVLTVERPCTESIEESPRCEPGDPAGTKYRSFHVSVCQGAWYTESFVGAPLAESVFGLAGAPFALAEMGEQPDWPADVPYGEQVLIFSPQDGAQLIDAVAVYIEGERIVRLQLGCRRAEQFLLEGPDGRQLDVVWQAPAAAP